MTHSPTLLILDGFAVFRLTHLLTEDTILEPVRERLRGARSTSSRTLGGEKINVVARPKLAEFIACPWCASPYLAVLVVVAQSLIPTVWFYAAAVLAFSAVAGLLARLG